MSRLPSLAIPVLFATLLSGAVLAAPVSTPQEDDFDFGTTQDLYDLCAAGPDVAGHVAAGFACRAFLAATVQYHDAVTARERLKPLICYPKGTTTLGDARDIFVAWGQRNASDVTLMAERPVKGVVRALAEKYPCK